MLPPHCRASKRADQRGEEEELSKQVELGELLPQRQAGVHSGCGFQSQQDDEHGRAADGQVDIEAPAPADVASESAT